MSRNWIDQLFEIDSKDRSDKAKRDAIELQREEAFMSLVPAWSASFMRDIREAIDGFNTRLAQHGRAHTVQADERSNGFELLARELHAYRIEFNAPAHVVEYGFEGEMREKLRLQVRDGEIGASSESIVPRGSEAHKVLSPYFERAVKVIT